MRASRVRLPSRGPLAWAVLAALACSSDAGEYDVVVRFASEALRTRSEVVEVDVVRECASFATTGGEPEALVHTTMVGQGRTATALGNVPPGRFGLYARARDARCNVYAAGCREYDLQADGTGTLEVTLGEVRGEGCTETELCLQGECGGPDGQGVCAMGTADCDRNAANRCEATLATDPRNCGQCAEACEYVNAAGLCRNGACALGACTQGWGDCDRDPATGCEADLVGSVTNCGACGARCAVPPHTVASCAAGRCGFTCEQGFADCDAVAANGCEADTRSSAAHCGRCGQACMYTNGTPQCVEGVCGLAGCIPGAGNCNGTPADGCEVDLRVSTTNCGACGAMCRNTNGTAACREGACVLTCATGFDDCDRSPANGCETDTVRSLAHCGGCGRSCAASANAWAACVMGRCAVTCNEGFGDCNLMGADGCETPLNTVANCGTCRHSCATGQVCTGGTCVTP